VLKEIAVNMPAGAGITQWFSVKGVTVDGTQSILVVTVADLSGRAVSTNVLALVPPYKMVLPTATVSCVVADAGNPDGSVDIAVTSNQVALYVTLTTLAAGRFSDNAFLLMAGTKTIQFLPFGALDFDSLRASLRAEHVAMYAA
jgi:hypothetical protein